MTDHSETGGWGIPEVKHLQMGGAPATREQSLIINSVLPLRTAPSGRINSIMFPIVPEEKDLLEYLDELAVMAGLKSLDEAISTIEIPGIRLLAIIHPNNRGRQVIPAPLIQLRNALLLAKTGTLVYDPVIPPVFTRRRLERNIDLIKIETNHFYELD